MEEDESGSADPVKALMDHDINISPRILIAVNDPGARHVAVAGLRPAGFCVSTATDGDAALMLARSFSPDVLVVDSFIPSPNGRPLYEQPCESSEQYLLCITGESEQRMHTSVLTTSCRARFKPMNLPPGATPCCAGHARCSNGSKQRSHRPSPSGPL